MKNTDYTTGEIKRGIGTESPTTIFHVWNTAKRVQAVLSITLAVLFPKRFGWITRR